MRLATRPSRRRDPGDRGEVSVQSIIIVPAMFTLCLLVVQASLWFHAANIAESAAARGAAAGSVLRASTGAATSAGRAALSENGAGTGSVSASMSADSVSVTVTVTVSHLVPFFPSTVTRTQSEPRERFIPEPQR
jgi:hypothetical protein